MRLILKINLQIPFLLFTFVLSIKTKIMKNTKDLNYYKNNCEEDYIKTPISVLRYITELEQALQLPQTDVSISLERAKKYARHQHYLGTQGKQLVEFEDWVTIIVDAFNEGYRAGIYDRGTSGIEYYVENFGDVS